MTAVLDVRGLRVSYGAQVALDDVSFSLAAGESLAIVGESGCGKTSLARCLAGLAPAAAGAIHIAGNEVTASSPAERGRQLQLVFQDPRSALNPRLTVATTLAEALDRAVGRAERVARIAAALREVDLDPEVAGRRPGTLSGGQAQRVAIARALLAEPRILVCDEAVSALDVITRQRILELLQRLRAQHDQSLVFIAHDLDAVRRIADRVLVMYAGRVVETGPVDEVFTRPAHPYTHALVAAVPRLGGPRPQGLPGEPAAAEAWRTGCAFAARCPRADNRCERSTPTLTGNDRTVACWYPETGTGT